MVREVLEANWRRGAFLTFVVSSATNFVWATTAWAQGSPEGPTNQGTSVLDLALNSAVFAALLGGLFGLWRLHQERKHDRIKREEDRQQQEEALLMALHAEIRVIRVDLKSHIGGIHAALKTIRFS